MSRTPQSQTHCRPVSRLRVGRWALLGLLGAALLLTVGQVVPQSLETREQELGTLRQDIVRLQTDLEVVRSREDSLEDRLNVARAELALQQAKVSEADQALALADARVEEARTKISSLEAQLDGVRGDLRRRLVGLYRLGGQGFLRLFLAMEGRENLLPSIRQLRFLVRRDRLTIDRYVQVRDQLSEQREVLEQQLAEAEAWRGQEVERRDELKKIERRRQKLLKQVAEERRNLMARTDALQEKERKLLRFMNDLVGSEAPPLDGAPVQEFRGVLDWPARGEVVAEFGPRKDPRYKTEVPHHGIDLKLDQGTKVRAVFPGEVVYASEFEGYGPMVVVHHPGRVFTLYAGLELVNVDKGVMLSLGDVVGLSAELLYFEIRVENEPQNPRQWLR